MLPAPCANTAVAMLTGSKCPLHRDRNHKEGEGYLEAPSATEERENMGRFLLPHRFPLGEQAGEQGGGVATRWAGGATGQRLSSKVQQGKGCPTGGQEASLTAHTGGESSEALTPARLVPVGIWIATQHILMKQLLKQATGAAEEWGSCGLAPLTLPPPPPVLLGPARSSCPFPSLQKPGTSPQDGCIGRP